MNSLLNFSRFNDDDEEEEEAMAREQSGLIHSLGLPRDLVGKLLNDFEQEPKEAGRLGSDALRRIFGAPPYTFLEADVPMFREFGRQMSGKKRHNIMITMIPRELREIITSEQTYYKIQFGFYRDRSGHTYKFEKDDHVSVKYREDDNKLSIPQRHDEVTVNHLDIVDYRVRFIIDDEISTGKLRTLLMKYTLIEVSSIHS